MPVFTSFIVLKNSTYTIGILRRRCIDCTPFKNVFEEQRETCITGVTWNLTFQLITDSIAFVRTDLLINMGPVVPEPAAWWEFAGRICRQHTP